MSKLIQIQRFYKYKTNKIWWFLGLGPEFRLIFHQLSPAPETPKSVPEPDYWVSDYTNYGMVIGVYKGRPSKSQFLSHLSFKDNLIYPEYTHSTFPAMGPYYICVDFKYNILFVEGGLNYIEII